MEQFIGGGSYEWCFKRAQQHEAHHILCWDSYEDVLDLSFAKGACITMEYEAHRNLPSSKQTDEGKLHRAQMRECLEKGDYRDAWNMGVKEIFCSVKVTESGMLHKYAVALAQAERCLLFDIENKVENKVLNQKVTFSEEFRKELSIRQVALKNYEMAMRSGESEKAQTYGKGLAYQYKEIIIQQQMEDKIAQRQAQREEQQRSSVQHQQKYDSLSL
jgi:hypothetical protein